ncbi:GGDEF domain-containing protein [Rhodopseudomonas pseudopalustris]|uniref:diguanylate cyclase n=3 Tax=Rhodopseudomonas TaxID=1073 RepID=Q13B77_RHOPS|nr:GGDEF domain-containing protein [Rhodopseudomonas pseudopalustris]ABE38662.1 diguanylate cyclase [Rhodopseudomonas palustris BisB5]MBB1092786.1 GGDEF domain-containing protein [Rhodopseudomonas palustris]SEO37889.1 diguanylate cyclase [Rhodopseudomonas pseudopalustris]
MKKTPSRPSESHRSGRKVAAGPVAEELPRSAAGASQAAPDEAPARAGAGAGRLPSDPQAKIRRLKAQLAAALAQIEELRASAETDFLLGISNRRGFERELNRALAYIKRYGAAGALILLDVDRLKPVNDTFGHAAGDVVLKSVVEALLSHVRASDLIGRLGGDEFALLLWNLSEADAHMKAAALEQTVDQLVIRFGTHTVAAGVSAGVAMLTADMDAAGALACADRAMYARKAERRAAEGKPDPVRR